MAAVAVRADSPASGRHNTTRRTQAKARAQRVRRVRGRFSKACGVVISILALALLFGYVSVYANLAVEGFNRSKLAAECKEQRKLNQRLKVEYNRLSSPDQVVAAAEQAGMVYACDYEYLHNPQTVAVRPKN